MQNISLIIYVDDIYETTMFGCIGLNRYILFVSFHLFNVSTTKFKTTCMARILFLLDALG